MNYSNYRASLDIHAAGSQAVLHAKQGDTKRQILVTLTEDGRPYLISSDCTAVFTAKKPDGNIIFNDCTIEGNLISYTFTAQTTVLAGRLDCEIRLYGADNGLITSPGFDIIVDATVYQDGDVVESAAEVSTLTSLVSEANALISSVNEKLENGEFKGESGVTAPVAGFFTMSVDDAGDLYAYSADGDIPDFSYDEETGDLSVATGPEETFIGNVKGPAGPAGADGKDGTDGGWYTPAVTQPDANTMRVAFTPSKEDMPSVAETDITLPAGGGGGGSSEDGGYYTPAVTQTTENTMQVAFTPSKEDMPAVEGKKITLPAGPKGDKGDTGAEGPEGAAGADGAEGKSAYAYAVEGGYTGTEAEFAAKLAQEMPTTLPNPNALTFTGAVTGSYDGSEALTVEIPSGGGAEAEHVDILSEGTLSEDVANIVADGFAKRMIALAVVPYGSTANSGTIKVMLQLGLDNGESLTLNPTHNFVTNSAAISWNKLVAFAFVDADTVDVTIYRDGSSTDTDISSSSNSNFWWAKKVYTAGVGKITSVTIGLQADGVIGKNTVYKVVGA